MNYIDSLKWRYATKIFSKERKLDEDAVIRIIESGNLSATSLGFQPIKILNIQDQLLREKIRTASFNQAQITDASHLLILCVDADFSKESVKKYMNLVATSRDIPTQDLSGFENMVSNWINGLPNDESRIEWAAKQAYITIGTMMTACAIEKIDSCPMEGFKPNDVVEILGLDKLNLLPVLMLPIGYRSVECTFQHLTKVRKPLAEYVINF